MIPGLSCPLCAAHAGALSPRPELLDPDQRQVRPGSLLWDHGPEPGPSIAAASFRVKARPHSHLCDGPVPQAATDPEREAVAWRLGC